MAKRKSIFGPEQLSLLLVLVVFQSVFCGGQQYAPQQQQQQQQQYYQQSQPNGAHYANAQFASQYPGQGVPMMQQQALQASSPIEDHREVDEKEYSVSGGSSWMWFLGMPIIFIPLILLLCTPLFHKPYDSPYHYSGGEQHGGGYGWGGHKEGWRRSSDNKVKEEITTRVMKGISNTAANSSKRPKTKGSKSPAETTSATQQQRG